MIGHKALRRDIYGDLRNPSPLYLYQGDTRHPAQGGAQRVGGESPKLGLREIFGLEREAEDGKNRGVHALNLDIGFRRQRGANLIDLRVDKFKSGEHIGAPREIHRYLCVSTLRLGTDTNNPWNGRDGLFDGASQGHLGHTNRAFPCMGDHNEARKGDLRQDGNGKRPHHTYPDNAKRYGNEKNGFEVLRDKATKVHELFPPVSFCPCETTYTFCPSESSYWPSRITCSPGATP